MEQHLSRKRIIQVLKEMKDASGAEFLLFSEKGKQIAGTAEDVSEQVLLAVQDFPVSCVESQIVQNWIFLRVEIEKQLEYILLCTSDGTESSYTIARMAVCQIRNLCISLREPVNKANFLRQILVGDIPVERIEEKNRKVHLRQVHYMIYVIRFARDKDNIILEMLKNLFVSGSLDYLLDMDDTTAVLVKNIRGIAADDYARYAHTIVDNMQSEAMTNVWVGYGEVTDTFQQMPAMYRNACTALKIGKIFYVEENVFCYSRLGIGRLIYQLPLDLCEMFLQEVLGENANTGFDEETLTTINQLFEHNLNISETARQLYIHRNTLVYRLERIEKKLGLDIRSFEDAMLFKIAMMVRTHVNEIRKKSAEKQSL